MADGNVVIGTAIDNSGAIKGLGDLRKEVAKLANEYKKQGMSASDAFKKAWSEIEHTGKSSARRTAKDTSDSFGGMASDITNKLNKLKTAIVTVFGTAAIIKFGKDSVKASTELTNAMTGLKSVMDGQGRSFSRAQSFIKEYIEDGLIPATDAVTAYKNLALRGYNTAQIEQVMTALKDSSAYGRQASYTMGEALKSATEGLKNENSILVDNAGVTKNVAQMWNDYAKSIGTTANNLTKQQRIQAEVLGIMEETKFQTGDAAKVANSFSGQLLRIQYGFNNLKIAVGNAIIPIATALLPYINAMITGLTKLANTFSQVIGVLLGQSSSQMAKMSDTSTAAAEGQDQLADSITKAGKAAKGALAPFDQLNILQQGTANAGTGGLNTGIGGTPAQGITPGMPNTTVPAESLASIDLLNQKLQPVITSIQNLGIALEPVKTFTSQGLIDMYNLFLVPLGEWVLGEAFPNLVTTLKDGLAQINWENLNNSLKNLWEKVTPFAENVGEGLLWFYDEVLVPLGVYILNDAAPVLIDMLTAAIDALNSIIDALKPLAKWLWENFLDPLAEWTGGIIVTVIELLTEALKKFSEWCKNNKEIVKTVTTIILTFMAELWAYNTAKNIAKWITGTLVPAFSGLITKLTALNVPLLVAGLGFAVLSAGIIALAMNWDKLTPVQRVITILGALAAAAIAAAIAIAVFHTAWSVGLAAAAIAGGLALLAGTYLFANSNKSPEDMLKGSGGSLEDAYSFANQVANGGDVLPKLAKGGIATAPVVAQVGDAGKEAILPLENNTGWMDILAAKIASVISAGSAGVGSVTIPIYLDGLLLDEYIISAQERVARRTNGRGV